MKNTKYYFEPKKYHTLRLDRNTPDGMDNAYSKEQTDLSPEMFYEAVEKLAIVGPSKVTVDTVDIDTIVWEEAKIPICIRYHMGNDNYKNMRNHHVYLKDIKTGEVISASVDLFDYDRIPSRPINPLEDGALTGGTLVYNITYFTDLPKYSTEYEVWIKIAGLESNHINIKLDLKEKGKLITRTGGSE